MIQILATVGLLLLVGLVLLVDATWGSDTD
jgi:hypothetical protein